MSGQSTPVQTSDQPQVEYRDLGPLGFPGYRVGDDGSVWSQLVRIPCHGFAYRTGGQWTRLRLYKDSRPGKGYLRVVLHDRRRGRHRFSVHRLILEAFVGPCPEGMECCHHDGNPANNRLANLRWDTRRQNQPDARRHGSFARKPRGERHGSAKLRTSQVLEIQRRGATGESAAALARAFGVSRTQVRNILSGKHWNHLARATS